MKFKYNANRHRARIWMVLGVVLLSLVAALFFHQHIAKTASWTIQSFIKTETAESPNSSDFYITIPDLNIKAPVIADVDGSNKAQYFTALQGGVAHMAGTKKPGEGGNIFIFGHSSYYPSDPGLYKEIFLNLEKINQNAEINIFWKGKNYQYAVTDTKIVDPTDSSVLNPTESEQLTLMTCDPPGTKLKRLIVIAKPK